MLKSNLEQLFESYEKKINFQYILIKADVLLFFLIFYLVRSSHGELLSKTLKKKYLSRIDHNIEKNMLFFMAVVQKNVFLTNLQNSWENTGSGISL